MNHPKLVILGTAQDAGIPQPNCFCENCLKATTEEAFKRTASSLAIVENNKWHLIDATPDLKEQMRKLQMTYDLQGQLMSNVFLTHAHLGHYPGILFLGREAINAQNIPVFAGRKMKELLVSQAPWRLLTELNNINLHELQDQAEINLSEDVSIKPLLIPHRNEFSETFGFIIKGPNKRVLYIPDIDQWDDWDIDIRDIAESVDICLLDGTFYSSEELKHIGRDFNEIPHPLITETMSRLSDITETTEVFFIHLNHSNPALDPDGNVRQTINQLGFHIAEDSMEIDL